MSLEGDSLKMTVGRSKMAKKPKNATHSQVIKKTSRQALKSVAKAAGSVRPDLKVS